MSLFTFVTGGKAVAGYLCARIGRRGAACKRFAPAMIKGTALLSLLAIVPLGLMAGRRQTSAAPPPPDQQINITVSDSKVGPIFGLLGGTCWQIGPTDGDPYDIVGDKVIVGGVDSTKVCPGAQNLLADKDSAVGSIRITISGALRARFGDRWSVSQTQVTPKYEQPAGQTFLCDLSRGKCELGVTEDLIEGDILVNVTDNVTGRPETDYCIQVFTPDQHDDVISTCDGFPADKDPQPGIIRVNVPFGDYHVRLPPLNNREIHPLGSKIVCSLRDQPLTRRTCKAAFVLYGQGLINIGVTDNETSMLVPHQCAEIRSPDQSRLFLRICDGDPGHPDGRFSDLRLGDGGIELFYYFGRYSVKYVGPLPPNRVLKQPGKGSCELNDTQKACDVAFELNAAGSPVAVGGISLDPGGSLPASGSDAWLLAGVIAGIAATAVALRGGVWYARRRRAR